MEIIVGTNQPIKHRVFWKGDIVDADSNPTVTLYSVDEHDNNVDPIYEAEAEKSETDIGVYNFYPDLSVTDIERELKAVWSYTVEGSPVLKEHEVYVIRPYADLSLAIDELGFGSDYSDPNHKTYDELIAAERYARKVIEFHTGQKFYLYDDTVVAYGAGSDILPFGSKIHQLHELKANDLLLIDGINNVNNWSGMAVQPTESGFGIRINRVNMLDNTVYSANGMVPPTINDYGTGVFTKNVRYTIGGIFGWEEVPDDVEIACIELMKDYFSKDKVWRNKYIKSISTFDWQFDFNTSTFSGTGNNYVDQLLLPYVTSKMVLI